jgi:hypothetical protein
VEGGIVLAFDQASNHVGYTRVDYATGRVLAVGGCTFPGKGNNDAATDYCCSVMDDLGYPHARIRAVAVEDAFFHPRFGWSTLNNLAELRGMVLREVYRRRLASIVVRPADWQGNLGLVGLKSVQIKAHSMRIAWQIVREVFPSADLFTEDMADSVHVGIKARGMLRERELGAAQQELLAKRKGRR